MEIDHFEINKIVWLFFKRHIDKVKSGTEDWVEFYRDADRTYSQYPCEYCKELIFAEANELERIYHAINKR